MALKDEMPKTAAFVADARLQYGGDYVTDLVKRAMKGERGCLYTVERIKPDQYRTFGAPFDWNAPDTELLGKCMALGLDFAGLIKRPKD